MDELIARFGMQIDGLVPFLALAHDTIYDAISPEMTPWYEPEEHPSILDHVELHQEQVAHGAFLLGYSYFEAFVTDLIFEVYRRRSGLLPAKEQLEYQAILSAQSLDDVIQTMIDQTTGSLNSLEKKLLHLEKRFGIGKDCPTLVREAHIARNALIHNSGRINRVPKEQVRWNIGDTISFDAMQSYQFLLAFKRFGADLFESIERLLERG
jgi:hypothetical protein